jgi:Cu+-exporting ATPase
MSITTDVRQTAKAMLSLTNLSCSFCSRVIERKLEKVPGIKDVAVSYLTDTALIRYDPQKITTQLIQESIKKLGYDSIERH